MKYVLVGAYTAPLCEANTCAPSAWGRTHANRRARRLERVIERYCETRTTVHVRYSQVARAGNAKWELCTVAGSQPQSRCSSGGDVLDCCERTTSDLQRVVQQEVTNRTSSDGVCEAHTWLRRGRVRTTLACNARAALYDYNNAYVLRRRIA